MSALFDPVSGLELGNSEAMGQLVATNPGKDELARAASSLILSASGWRKVFAASGDEEDARPDLSPADALIAGLMATVWTAFMARTLKKPLSGLTLVMACDSRPTGTLMADAMIRVCLAAGVKVQHTFISSAPETMAYARLEPGVDGFAYISASHNPIGHNGVKFGFNNGGVIGGEDAKILIEEFKALLENPDAQEACRLAMISVDSATLEAVFRASAGYKKKSLSRYREFSRMVSADSDDLAFQNTFVQDLSSAVNQAGIGIVAELNGSARCLTIDQEFFREIGAKVHVVNGTPRAIVHRIVPEGKSLDQCRMELEAAHARDRGFLLGYVPDNDGDRGNVTWLDTKTGKAHVIEAQEVFALTVLAELAHLAYSGKLRYGPDGKALDKVAVAVNDPTSMRIEDLAQAFDVQVFRAEVGEANVVNLAANLRKKGFMVRVLGEGSNGGNITHPAAVRDPLNTIVSLLKLLTMKDIGDKPGLYHLYCQRAGIAYKADFTLGDILASLPAWVTTSAYEDRALAKIGTQDHGVLKARYEDVFRTEWEQYREELKRKYGIHSWEEINYEGTQETRGVGKSYRTGKERGGFKILFKDDAGRHVAFMWMRGSGTEPVFRVLVDARGKDTGFEAWLLDWHVRMIMKADKA